MRRLSFSVFFIFLTLSSSFRRNFRSLNHFSSWYNDNDDNDDKDDDDNNDDDKFERGDVIGGFHVDFSRDIAGGGQNQSWDLTAFEDIPSSILRSIKAAVIADAKRDIDMVDAANADTNADADGSDRPAVTSEGRSSSSPSEKTKPASSSSSSSFPSLPPFTSPMISPFSEILPPPPPPRDNFQCRFGEVSVAENIVVGTNVTRVVVDAVPPNSILRFELLPGGDVGITKGGDERFGIGVVDGVVRTEKLFDAETDGRRSWSLRVRVTSKSASTRNASTTTEAVPNSVVVVATCLVVVRVEDVNEFAPILDHIVLLDPRDREDGVVRLRPPPPDDADNDDDDDDLAGAPLVEIHLKDADADSKNRVTGFVIHQLRKRGPVNDDGTLGELDGKNDETNNEENKKNALLFPLSVESNLTADAKGTIVGFLTISKNFNYSTYPPLDVDVTIYAMSDQLRSDPIWFRVVLSPPVQPPSRSAVSCVEGRILKIVENKVGPIARGPWILRPDDGEVSNGNSSSSSSSSSSSLIKIVVEDDSRFEITPNGTLVLYRGLDFESERSFQIKYAVHSNSSSSSSSYEGNTSSSSISLTCRATVQVVDVNDNPPRLKSKKCRWGNCTVSSFSSSDSDASSVRNISSDAAIGDGIVEYLAMDEDEGDDGKFAYRVRLDAALTASDADGIAVNVAPPTIEPTGTVATLDTTDATAHLPFSIERRGDVGRLRVSSSLTSWENQIVRLLVAVVDEGTPRLTSVVDVVRLRVVPPPTSTSSNSPPSRFRFPKTQLNHVFMDSIIWYADGATDLFLAVVEKGEDGGEEEEEDDRRLFCSFLDESTSSFLTMRKTCEPFQTYSDSFSRAGGSSLHSSSYSDDSTHSSLAKKRCACRFMVYKNSHLPSHGLVRNQIRVRDYWTSLVRDVTFNVEPFTSRVEFFLLDSYTIFTKFVPASYEGKKYPLWPKFLTSFPAACGLSNDVWKNCPYLRYKMTISSIEGDMDVAVHFFEAIEFDELDAKFYLKNWNEFLARNLAGAEFVLAIGAGYVDTGGRFVDVKTQRFTLFFNDDDDTIHKTFEVTFDICRGSGKLCQFSYDHSFCSANDLSRGNEVAKKCSAALEKTYFWIKEKNDKKSYYYYREIAWGNVTPRNITSAGYDSRIIGGKFTFPNLKPNTEYIMYVGGKLCIRENSSSCEFPSKNSIFSSIEFYTGKFNYRDYDRNYHFHNEIYPRALDRLSYISFQFERFCSWCDSDVRTTIFSSQLDDNVQKIADIANTENGYHGFTNKNLASGIVDIFMFTSVDPTVDITAQLEVVRKTFSTPFMTEKKPYCSIKYVPTHQTLQTSCYSSNMQFAVIKVEENILYQYRHGEIHAEYRGVNEDFDLNIVGRDSTVENEISFFDLLKRFELSSLENVMTFVGSEKTAFFEWHITMTMIGGEGRLGYNPIEPFQRNLICNNCNGKHVLIDMNPNLYKLISLDSLSKVSYSAKIRIVLNKDLSIDNHFIMKIKKSKINPEELRDFPSFSECFDKKRIACSNFSVKPSANYPGCLSLFSNCLEPNSQLPKWFNSNILKKNNKLVKNTNLCNDGYTGSFPNCSDVDECSQGNPCQGNECLNYDGGFACSPCKKGSIPIPTKILNSSLAIMKTKDSIPFFRFGLLSYDAYFTGLKIHYDYKCKPEKCTVVREYFLEDSGALSITRTRLCHEKAYCTGDGSEVKCICRNGYRGNGLECSNVNECEKDKACPAPSICIDLDPGYFCQCPKGWYGDNCQISVCKKNPCYRGGKCMLNENSENGYYCRCPLSHSGKHCTDVQKIYTFRPNNREYSSATFVMLSSGKKVFEREGIIFQTRLKTYDDGGTIFNLASQDGNAHNTFIGRTLELRNSSLVLLIFSASAKKPFVCEMVPMENIADGRWHDIKLTINISEISIYLDENEVVCSPPKEYGANYTKLDMTGDLGQPNYAGLSIREEGGGIRHSSRSSLLSSNSSYTQPLTFSFKGLLQGARLNGELLKLNNVNQGRPPTDDNKSFFYFNKRQGIVEGIVNDDRCKEDSGACQNGASCHTKNYNVMKCFCTKQFYGTYCQKKLACANVTENKVTYPELFIDQVYRSEQRCLKDNEIVAKITRRCLSKNGDATWEEPETITECEPLGEISMSTSKLLQLLTNKENSADETIQSLHSMMQNTSQYSINDVKLTVEIMDKVSKKELSVENLNDLLDIINNILNKLKQHTKMQKIHHHASIKILDRIIINTRIPDGKDSVSVFTNDIILAKYKVTTSKKLSGFSLSSSKDGFGSESLTRVNGETDFGDLEDTNQAATIILPEKYMNKLLDETENSVSFLAFEDSAIFENNDIQEKATVASVIVGCTLAKGEPSLNIFENNEFVKIKLKNRINMTAIKDNSSYACVFWDTFNNVWSKNGCFMISQKSDYFECKCNHLTNLAVLFSYQNELPVKTTKILNVINQVFMGISIVSLGLVVIFFLFFKEFRKKRIQQVIFGMSLSLLITYVFFFITIENKENHNVYLCQIGAVLMHYFLLSAFGWTVVEAIVQYFMFVKVLGTYVSKFMLKGALFAHGLPLIIVIIVLATDTNHYGPSDINEETICWLDKYPFFFALVLPIGLMLFINTVCFGCVLKALMSKDTLRGRRHKGNLPMAKIGIILFLSLGLTWLMGFLLLVPTQMVGQLYTIIFTYLFTICNALQGLSLFALHFLRSPTLRSIILCKKSTQEHNTSSDIKASTLHRSRLSRLTPKDTVYVVNRNLPLEYENDSNKVCSKTISQLNEVMEGNSNQAYESNDNAYEAIQDTVYYSETSENEIGVWPSSHSYDPTASKKDIPPENVYEEVNYDTENNNEHVHKNDDDTISPAEDKTDDYNC